MDTEFTVSIVLEGNRERSFAAAAADACFARIDALEALLTRFNDTSDVAVVGALGDGQIAVVAPETMDVLVASANACAATGGAFDPTVEARTFAELTLDPGHLRVGVRHGPVALDFGGIGKGYALDECAKILAGEQYDLHDWLLDAGSSTILVSGRDANGNAWPLGVGGPFKPRTRLDVVVRLESGALSGSGFEVRGEHIADVRRGGPARRWAQSWAVAPTAAMADALTTAALSLSPAELERAAATLSARILVARRQSRALDRLRDPLKWFGDRRA